MYCLIVLAHPEKKSFNAQMAHVAKRAFEAGGHQAEVVDLYHEEFDPKEALHHFSAPIAPDYFSAGTEQRHASNTHNLPPVIGLTLDKLERADVVVFQFPLWWWSVPAILKGWLDRVLVSGRTYTSTVRYDCGHFKGKQALVSVTAGASEIACSASGRCADLDLILWPLHFSLNFVGFSVLPPYACFDIFPAKGADGLLLQGRIAAYKTGFDQYITNLSSLEPLPFNKWADWDDTGKLKPGAPSYSPFIRHI